MLKEFVQRAVEGIHLNAAEARTAMGIVLRGEGTPAQLAAWLVALRLKGETTGELEGFARAMREAMVTIENVPSDAIDTCGTGGDGLGTFNVSTAAGLIAAAAGATVAKHGNRAVSSNCGSADVLAALGFEIDPGLETAARALHQTGFAFFFAPRFHPAMKHAAVPRREIGVRTIFNLLGPICNPALVSRQVIGVFDRRWQRPLAETLRGLGATRVMIVSGPEGADELLPTGTNHVTELNNGSISEYELGAEDAGVGSVTINDIKGSTADGNADIIRTIATGKDGPTTETALMNAGAALCVAGKASTIGEGVALARGVTTDGAVAQLIAKASAASRGEST